MNESKIIEEVVFDPDEPYVPELDEFKDDPYPFE